MFYFGKDLVRGRTQIGSENLLNFRSTKRLRVLFRTNKLNKDTCDSKTTRVLAVYFNKTTTQPTFMSASTQKRIGS